MTQAIIDSVEGISLNVDAYMNEFSTLQTLTRGILHLANQVHAFERDRKPKEGTSHWVFGASKEELPEVELVTCHFHWFATTVCNYARLVGLLRVLASGIHCREDLTTKQDDVNASINDYVGAVTEIAALVQWRNRIAAHFAITAPRKKDNDIASLEYTITHPVTLHDGIYYVGEIGIHRSSSGKVYKGELPVWSLTEVFGSLIPRYWPHRIVPAD